MTDNTFQGVGSVNGGAWAWFSCRCGKSTIVSLTITDGWRIHPHPTFVIPEGWRVELGATTGETIVRCPDHCAWVGSATHYVTGEEIPARWEDVP